MQNVSLFTLPLNVLFNSYDSEILKNLGKNPTYQKCLPKKRPIDITVFGDFPTVAIVVVQQICFVFVIVTILLFWFKYYTYWILIRLRGMGGSGLGQNFMCVFVWMFG